MSPRTRVGLIGTGLMGTAMARRLLWADLPLTVWNRTAAKAQPLLDEGAAWAASPRAVATASDIVITMVTDSAAVREVVCGPDGALAGAHPGLIVVDMSSIEPSTSQLVAARAAEAGVGFLDAPVVGSTPQAADGTLGILVGGERAHFDAAAPVLSRLGSKLLYAGSSGSGTTLKLINQLVFAVVLEVNAEALVLAAKAGVDPALLIEVLMAGGARTVAMEGRGPRILQGDFAPRFSLANQYKDLGNSLAMARELGAPTPTGAAVHEIYKAAVTRGRGDLDSSIVVEVLEDLANARVRRQQPEARDAG